MNTSNNTRQNQIVNAMRSSGGRFFGLTTTQGASVNGRFVSESAKYINVYDRHNNEHRKIAKSSLASLRLGSTVI
jgi:hypothetical protein